MPLGYQAESWGQTEGNAPSWIEIARQRQRPKALWEVIPNDPDYRRYIPIEYRLNAKGIVGELAQDLQRGRSAHIWVDLAHYGLTAAEIAGLLEGTSALVGALSVAGPFLAAAATFLALGLPYQEAAAKIAKDWAATGYSRGVVMGANQRSPSLVREYYGNLYFPRNPQFPAGTTTARMNHQAGLVAGYVHGRALRENQRVIFWHDLGRREDQSYRGPQSQWRSRDWRDWYTTSAAVFRRDHLTA